MGKYNKYYYLSRAVQDLGKAAEMFLKDDAKEGKLSDRESTEMIKEIHKILNAEKYGLMTSHGAIRTIGNMEF
jgi:hypothetical protein